MKRLNVFIVLALIVTSCATRRSSVTPTPKVRTPDQPSPTTTHYTPTPTSGRIRSSVIAGLWYPDDPQELTIMVDGFLSAVRPIDGEPIAIIVPHAGYVYSGHVAAHGFKQLEGVPYESAVIIASDHQTPLSSPISVWADGGFETPLGIVPVNVELAQALVDADPRIQADYTAHQGEHPIEIELPFLQRVCPGCSIVPILMSSDDEEIVQALADALIPFLSERPAVVIASSDLSHYPAYEDALNVDSATLGAIETGDTKILRLTLERSMTEDIPQLLTCACGEGPILTTMLIAEGLNANNITLLHYANSGDIPVGDREQVVGYGSLMFWRYEPPALNDAQRRNLLQLARTAIEEHLESSQITPIEITDQVLLRRAGVFVTLKEEGELRGCIGHLWADTPLYQIVQHMAVKAATSDARFAPVTREELDHLHIEISVLSPLHRLTDIDQIEVGTHGLLIFQEGRQAVMLPQVAIEEGWDRDTFIESLCLKAGSPADCITDQATLYSFTAIVFGE